MKQKTQSVIKTLNISYLILSISTLIIVSSVLIFAWTTSNNQLIDTLQHEAQSNLLEEVEEVLTSPVHIIKFGQTLLNTEAIDITESAQRDPYFVSALDIAPDHIYSYSMGTPDGYYYGARRSENGSIEIMLADESTDFHSIYYGIDSTYNRGEKILTNPVFDPRSRPWYTEALNQNNSSLVFSPIYKHFVMDDLALSISAPVFDDAHNLLGVLGAHFTLNRLNEQMHNYATIYKGDSYIIEADSELVIANSLGLANYKMSSNYFERIPFSSLGSQEAIDALNHYKQTGEGNYVANAWPEETFLRIVPYSSYGLDWLIVIEIPTHPIIKTYYTTILVALILIMILAVFSSYAWSKRNKKVLQPIIELTNITQAYSEGNHNLRVYSYQDNEFGRLAKGFNQMADTISTQMETLEEKVAKRTQALQKLNKSLLDQQNTIVYLSYHDQLTGLYNRRYFEETLKRLDNSHNLPISLVMIDMNGLKLINDAFGHAIGDSYLKKLAEIIRHHLRTSDVAARYGGDEFIIILPKTNTLEAKLVLKRLYDSIEKPDVGIVPLSISYGIKTKNMPSESIIEILNTSDETMYTKKLTESQVFRSLAIEKILNHLKEHFPLEHQHALDVQKYSIAFATYLNLDTINIEYLHHAAYMHDIGKVSFPRELVEKPMYALTPEEFDVVARHTEIGYRILTAASETQAYAEIVLEHHENWNGEGYPKGLKGTEILIEARILHIVENYVTFVNDFQSDEEDFDTSLAFLHKQKGAELDPELVDAFINFLKQNPHA